MSNSSNRFTNTVDNYVKYRPSYPKELMRLLIEKCGLKASDVIADVGSGTGILSKLFLDFGNNVYGVEPNKEMREAAQKCFSNNNNFHSVNGTAESTTLTDDCVDFIVVGTAFHWFDVNKTKAEFQRILRNKGWVVSVWNVRDVLHSELMQDYENILLKYGKGYKEERSSEFDEKSLIKFFNPNKMLSSEFNNIQSFDWQGLKGRLLSTSYSLRERDKKYDEMINELKSVFEQHQEDGRVEFLYSTKVYYARLE